MRDTFMCDVYMYAGSACAAAQIMVMEAFDQEVQRSASLEIGSTTVHRFPVNVQRGVRHIGVQADIDNDSDDYFAEDDDSLVIGSSKSCILNALKSSYPLS
jgi:hypothetical protein